MDFSPIKRRAIELLSQKRSHGWKEKGNKYYHGERVANLALQMRRALYPTRADLDDALQVAAWFHDIENGRDDHARRGALTTREALAGLCPPALLERACAIIAVHDDRGPQSSEYAVEIQLHQDADLVDHFGTHDIWTYVGQALHEEIPLERFAQTLARGGYLPEHRTLLHYELSRRIFDERTAFSRAFGERMAVECRGEIWALDALLGAK